ncbi:hypothetical protein Tsubulata_005787 [Turnera subulata]|uniref:Homeobox domain-containing protein n=1 Tax=Turnera subulata TaxID=218843 RepID=A0A9Q0F8U3_9ROSI|nr:hypothetical protein Tsubulata_005787 [Turnera subulata]
MSPPPSTRWCPTPEQLMILEELYATGIKTPNASQIQRITAHLSLYGKIEGKNVFYWFQNHKARDRQKLRRKLIKQLQHQLHPYYSDQLQILSNHQLIGNFESPATSTSFHELSYHCSASLPPQRGCEGVMNCCSWNMMVPQIDHQKIENSGMRMSSDAYWRMMVEASSTPPLTRPLKTLQLFPITATNLKEEGSTTNPSSKA